MESGPEVFAGAAFALFGAALLLWTGVCLRTGAPVAEGTGRVVGPVTALLFGAVFLGAGCWMLTLL